MPLSLVRHSAYLVGFLGFFRLHPYRIDQGQTRSPPTAGHRDPKTAQCSYLKKAGAVPVTDFRSRASLMFRNPLPPQLSSQKFARFVSSQGGGRPCQQSLDLQSCRASISKQKLHTNYSVWGSRWCGVRLLFPQPTFRLRHSKIFCRTTCATQGSYLVFRAMSRLRQKRPGGRRLLSGHMAVWGLLHRNSDKTRPKTGRTMSCLRH